MCLPTSLKILKKDCDLFFCKGLETSERDVFAHIFKNYEKRLRPIRNESEVIIVQIQMNIISLLEVVKISGSYLFQ